MDDSDERELHPLQSRPGLNVLVCWKTPKFL